MRAHLSVYPRGVCGLFACITVGLIVGALAERIRFSAVLIFVWYG